MSHLFSKFIITEALRNLEIPDIEGKISTLQVWLDMYNSGSLQKKSEKEFEGVYNESLFGTILGYTSASNGEYTREKEPRNESNGQKCDIGLGFYNSEISLTQAVIELKDAATSLDRPQQRAGNLTPVQQAFKYKPLYNSKWVIVSNFFEIRLYTDTYKDFESFTLRELTDPRDNYLNFRKFYLLFHADRLIRKEGESETEKLLAKVRIEEEKISKEFYREYKTLRLELMRNIWHNNPETRNADVIEKSQFIIDRIVFICFCEDRGLLPQNKLQENILRAKEIDLTPWETLKIFFRSVDKGSDKLGIPDGYNGGLFRENETIDNLKISDAIVEKFINLSRYDFSEDGGQLSVEILGHIFEQSISDIEEIRNQIENQGKVEEEKDTEKKVSKRKKDGIFYTPAYIVEYIVTNSLGKYLGEHEEALKDKYKLKEDILEKNYRKREIEAYTEYQKILHNVKVLDPACGSGAFLVRVFDWLKEENIRVDRIINGETDTISMIETNANAFYAEILKNNIYGVDLNEESVEITKLSLWLKSAVKGKKLVTLDANIKCGNSLIDDPAVAGDKAFDWNTEFADIMANGGFDVIVGNPPYVTAKLGKLRQSIIDNEMGYFKSKYPDIVEYKGNLYSLFIAKVANLLNNKGKFSFITPNTFLLSSTFGKLRKYIISFFFIDELLNLKFEPFNDASTGGCVIFVFSKKTSGKPLFTKVRECSNGNDVSSSSSVDIDFGGIYEDFDGKFITNLSGAQIVKKCFLKSKNLAEIVSFYQGIITGDNKKYLSERAIDNRYKQVVRGGDIERYGLHFSGNYVLFDPKLLWSNTDSSKFETTEKLINRQTSSNLIVTYDDTRTYSLDSTHIQNLIDQDFSLKYILTLENSSLLNYIYTFFVDEGGRVFPQVKTINLKRLPIGNVPLTEQQPFIDRADLMLTLNKQLHEKSSAFLTNISTKYKTEKITRKLEKWWELDFADFVRELKAKLSLEEQEELMAYFDKRKTEVRDIVANIEATDKEIDDMVFELYGLTEEERKVVLNS